MVEGGEDLADLFGRILGSGQGRLRLGDRGTGNGEQQKQSADGHGKPSRRYRPGIDGTRGEIAIPVGMPVSDDTVNASYTSGVSRNRRCSKRCRPFMLLGRASVASCGE
jgi:hypothetical protein